MSGPLTALAACGLLVGAALAGPNGTDDPAGVLAVTDWEGSALARRVGGSVAVLAGDDGALRWEIGVAPDSSLGDLLVRRGRGWTVVLAPNGRGTRNAWGAEWHPLEAALGRVLAAATRAALVAAEVRPSRVVVPDEPGSLRARLAHRGGGRGGPGEVVRLRPDADGGTILSSTRRPGAVRFAPWRRLPVRYPARESFAPLWPLEQLLEFTAKSGNPAG